MDGFTTGRFNNLTPLPGYPLDYVFRGVINQSFNDLQVIEWAIDQRRNGSDAMRDTLAIADQLAFAALQPAIQSDLVPAETAVITYFEKFASIRIIPYANVALIGIPFSCVSTPEDFLAIPHEVGHYVFGRASRANGNVRKLLNDDYGRQRPDYVKAWIEEIAADVYGCLIAGPVIALDFQDLQLEKRPQKFNVDDGEHPTPILRPQVYHKVLHHRQSPWSGPLDAAWTFRREQFKVRHQDKIKDPNKFQPATMPGTLRPEQALSDGVALNSQAPVDWVINAVLQRLALRMGNDNWWQAFRDLPLGDVPPDLDATQVNAHTLAAIKRTIYAPVLERLTPVPRRQALPNSPLPSIPPQDWQYMLDNLDEYLPTWPEPFFKVERGPDDWWVNVWIARGWNTFGNGQWIQ